MSEATPVNCEHADACERDIKALMDQVGDQFSEIDRLQAREKVLTEALEEIAEGKGRFSQDPFTHACNTIEDMKALATAALARTGQEG